MGGTPRPAFSAPPEGALGHPAWSPDGTRLAYRLGSVLHVYTVATGEHREIGQGHWPVWSPDGEWIAYTVGNLNFVSFGRSLGNIAPSAIRVAPADGGPSVTVALNEDQNVSPTWLPDGRLLFVSNRGGGRDVYAVELNGDGMPRQEPVRVTTGLDPHTISLSRDGRTLVYSTLLRRQNVWSIEIPRGDPVSGYDGERVTTGRQVIEGMAVSPDGRSLAFDSNRSGNQDLYVQPLDAGPPVQVTDHPADEFVKAWSPDGRWLTGHGFRNGNRDIFVVRADGTDHQTVYDSPTPDRYPDWSPDGRSLVFQSILEDGTALFVTDGGGGSDWSEPRRLTTGSSARWSPDGERIAFSSGPSAFVVDLNGEQRRNVFEGNDVETLFWSSDREIIVLDRLDDGTTAFREVSVDGSAARTLVEFDDLLRLPRAEFFVHGGRIYYTFAELEGDLWVMDLEW